MLVEGDAFSALTTPLPIVCMQANFLQVSTSYLLDA